MKMRAPQVEVSVNTSEVAKSLTYCGVLIKVNDWPATVALWISRGKDVFLLTVDHVIPLSRRPYSDVWRNLSSSFPIPRVFGSQSLLEHYGVRMNQEYTDSKSLSETANDPSTVENGTKEDEVPPLRDTSPTSWSDPQCLEVAYRSSSDRRYRGNWALIKVNRSINGDGSSTTKLSGTLSFEQSVFKVKREFVSVVMISGSRGLRSGILQSGRAFSAGPHGKLYEFLRLDLDDHQGVIEGESGSLVLTKEGHQICGHVVGEHALGSALVSPFEIVAKELQKAFGSRKTPPQIDFPVIANIQRSDRKVGNSLALSQLPFSHTNTHDNRDLYFWYSDLRLGEAASSGDLKSVNSLLVLGANPTVLPRAYNAKTAEQAAKIEGNKETLRILSAAKIDRNGT